MSTETLRETIYAKISDAFYDARNSGRTMTDAANEATDAVLAALAPPTMERALAMVEAHQYAPSPARGVSKCTCGVSLSGMPHLYRVHIAQQIAALHPGPTRAERGQ